MDDLLMNDGSTFFQATEPIEQVNARKKAKAYMEEMQDTLKGTIARLDERIAFYDSTKCIPFDPKTQPQEFMNAYNAAQLTRENLLQEKEYLSLYIK